MIEDFSDDFNAAATSDALPATDAVSTEMATLESEMKDTKGHDPAGYWNSPAKQARYRQLIEVQDSDAPAQRGAGQDVSVAEGDVSGALDALSGMGEIGAEFAAEIGRSGAKPALEIMTSVEQDILSDIGASADEVSSAFDGLPSNVQGAVYKEFASAYTPQLPAADPADLEDFAESGAGRILMSEWGQEAPRRLSVALFRWNRMTEGLSPREVAAVDDFYLRRLGADERAAVLRRLAV